MELPEEGLVRLGFDPEAGRWVAKHQVTGECISLPPTGSNVWEVSFVDGAALMTNGREQLWLADLMQYRLAKSPSGDLFLVGSNDDIAPLLPKLQAHDKHDVSIAVGRRPAVLRVICYEQEFVGARLWWSFSAIWGCLALDSTMSESQWRESWWPWWSKMLEQTGFPAPPHLRRGMPARAAGAKPDKFLDLVPTRHLDEASCTSHALVAIACKAAAQATRSTGASPSNKKNQAAWRELLDGLFAALSDGLEPMHIIIYLDTTGIYEATLPLFGADPVALAFSGGVLDLSPLASSTALGRRLHQLFAHADRLRVCDVMVTLSVAGKAFVWARKQFLHIFGGLLERSILRGIVLASGMDIGACLGRRGHYHLACRLGLSAHCNTCLVSAPPPPRLILFRFATRHLECD